MSPALRIVCLSAAGLYLAFALLLATQVKNGLDPAGAPLGYDFSAYYEAAQFAKAGAAAVAFDDAQMIAAERARFPGSKTRLPWNYPPSFQLLLLPLSILPYAAALALWSAALLGGYVLLLRRLSAPPEFWPLLLFPGAIMNVFLGTNGLMIALFLGGGLLALERRPWLGGVLLGLASVKPHLAAVIPLALFFGRHHRALAAMLLTAALLAAASALAFGIEPWTAFAAKALNAGSIAQASSSDWRRVPSLYTLMLTLGLPTLPAALLHGAAALAALAGLFAIWRAPGDPLLRNAALALAILIVTPYARVYDLALLLFPLLWLARDAKQPAERVCLAVLWIAPLAGLLVAPILPALSLLGIALMAVAAWQAGRAPLEAFKEKAAPQAP